MKAVFISDLHLSPDKPEITARFTRFLEHFAPRTQAIYILGDFFDAWAGDDGLAPWSQEIIQQLKQASASTQLYFMHGNRDFLMGAALAQKAGMTVLSEPTVIHLEGRAILLAHGDGYCTKDKRHQWFRRITRHPVFAALFLKLPLSLRQKMVKKVRNVSLAQPYKVDEMDVVVADCLAEMDTHYVHILIHGHTHRAGLNTYFHRGRNYLRYVLSDWDDTPKILCYDITRGLYFVQLD